jgi:hypothetical protein
MRYRRHFFCRSDSVIASVTELSPHAVQVVGRFSQWLPQQMLQALGPIYKIIYQDEAARIPYAVEDLKSLEDQIQVTRSYPHILELVQRGFIKDCCSMARNHYTCRRREIW